MIITCLHLSLPALNLIIVSKLRHPEGLCWNDYVKGVRRKNWPFNVPRRLCSKGNSYPAGL